MNTETVLHLLWLPYSKYFTLSVWPSWWSPWNL